MKVLNDLARSGGRRIKHLRSRKPYRALIFATVAIVAGFVVGMKAIDIDVFAQSFSRSDEKNISLAYSREPQIRIKEVRVGEQSRRFDENFKEDSNWISRTSFQIENISGKPIVYLKLNVIFPETRESNSVMSSSITFGRRPGSKFQTANPFQLAAKESRDVSLASEYAKISDRINKQHSIEQIKRIQLEVGFIVFSDGTAWSAGTFFLPDPNNPGGYISPPEVKQ